MSSGYLTSVSPISHTSPRALSCADLQRESAWFQLLDGHEDYAKGLAAQGLHPNDPHTLAELNEDLLTTLGINDRNARARILGLVHQGSSLKGATGGLASLEVSAKSTETTDGLKSHVGDEDEAPTFGRFTRRCFSKRIGRIERMTIPAQEVVPGIFLGGVAAAEDRTEQRSLGITHVLNATNHPPKAPLQGLKMMMLHLRDGDGEQDLTKHFPACIDFIDEAFKEGGAVLVHCVRGVSRSAALVIAYLICRAGMTFEDALALTKRARPIAQPRRGFCKQLQALSIQHKSKKSNDKMLPVSQSQQLPRRWTKDNGQWRRSNSKSNSKKMVEP